MKMIMLSRDKNVFDSCLGWIPFILFSCFIALARHFQCTATLKTPQKMSPSLIQRVCFKLFTCVLLTALLSFKCFLSSEESHISLLFSSKFLLLLSKNRFFISLLLPISICPIIFHFDLYYFHSPAYFGLNFLSFSQLSKQALVM